MPAVYSKQKLYEFVDYNSQYRMHSEDDVHQYYREFHIFCQPLIGSSQITTGERNSAFWYRFHPQDRDKLSFRLVAKLPNQWSDQHYDIEEVFKTAISVFTSSPYVPIELQERWNHHPSYSHRPDLSSGQWYDQPDRTPRVSDHEGRMREHEPYFTPRDSYSRREDDWTRKPDHAYCAHDHNYYHSRAPSPPHARNRSPPRARSPPRSHSPPHACDRSPPRNCTRFPPRAHSPPRARDHSPPRTRAHSPPRARDHSPPHTRSPPPPSRTPGPSTETHTVRFKEPPMHEEEDRELDKLMDKLHSLSIQERSYAILYARCVHRFPDIAQSLPKPELSQSYAFQNAAPSITTPCQPWTDRSAPVPPAISSEDTFFCTCPASCIFCSQTNHLIRECPLAQEYMQSKRASIIGNQMHLPNGQPIPSNSIGHNLKEKIDTWLAGSVAAVPPNPSDPMFNRDPPPHATHCFEIVTKTLYSPPVQEAHIVEVPPVGEENKSDDEDADLFEVFAAEQKRRNAKATQLPELVQAKEPEEIITPAAASSNSTNKSPPIVTPAKPTSSSKNKSPQSTPPANDPTPPIFVNEPLPSSTSHTMPQYHYLSNAEDQQLTAELFKWLLDGKLSLITPAHILTASPSIHKELIERLKTCRVDTGGYDVPSILKPVPPSSVLKLSTPRPAEYSLPLREIDVLVNGIVPEAGILDQGSQIIAI
jgi:hypothetical protein